jgi:hypothetical protein
MSEQTASCHCPAGPGQPCPHGAVECLVRVQAFRDAADIVQHFVSCDCTDTQVSKLHEPSCNAPLVNGILASLRGQA